MFNSVHSTSVARAENPIVAALDRPKFTVDEKGNKSLSEWGVNDQRLAMSFKTVRGLDRESLATFVRDIVSDARKMSDPTQELQGYVDMFVMAFNTRDINEGKGERDLFYWFLLELYKLYPKTVFALLPSIPEKYGSYLDFNKLYEIASEPTYDALRNEIVRLYAEHLEKDNIILTQINSGNKSQKPSLAAKWAPREGSHFGELGKAIAMKIFSSKPMYDKSGVPFKSYDAVKADIMSNGQLTMSRRQEMISTDKTLKNSRMSCLKRYRNLVSTLNKYLQTTEIKMCNGHWSDINPGSVPARCLSKHSMAFRNLNKDKKSERSSNEDRRKCALNFASHLQKAIDNPTEVRVHGKNMMPHELVRKYMNNYSNIEIDPVVEAQWIDLRERLKELGALDNFIAMADTSGSMSGTPMEVSVALSILISEIATPAFADRFMTFSSVPTWHNLSGLPNLMSKVRSAMSAPWQMNTDFNAALQMILDACVENKVSSEEVSKITLAVFSDMQFDQAYSGNLRTYDYATRTHKEPVNFKTKHDMIANKFKDAGFVDPVTGKGIVPTIIFWNLRGDTVDFPASADTPGVSMVSGFSANGLKCFMNGSLMEMAAEKPPTPYDIFRKTIDSERYDSVRQTCQAVGEIKAQNGQTYVAPVKLVEEPHDSSSVTTIHLDDNASSVDEFVPIDVDGNVIESSAPAPTPTPTPASVSASLDDKIARAEKLLAQLHALRDF
jgi:hypothetical protein